jgi:hypothetical protein
MPFGIEIRTNVDAFKPGNEQVVELAGEALEKFPNLKVEIKGRHGMRAGTTCKTTHLSCIRHISGFNLTDQDGKTFVDKVEPAALQGCEGCIYNSKPTP